MQQEIEPKLFDPAQFVRDHPNDERFQDALNSVRELVERTAPPQPDERPLDARQRIEQGFDLLWTRLEGELELSDKQELSGYKLAFIHSETAQITARHQPGIDATRDLERKSAGQFARHEEIDHFLENIDTNAKLKIETNELVENQAIRRDAVSWLVTSTANAVLKQYGLEQVEMEPMPEPPSNKNNAIKNAPIGSDEFKAALQNERAAIEQARVNELLISKDFKMSR